MTPLGRPTNFTNPDSAGLYDPRPDDDPLNINPLLEAQSVVRQQTVNRVFGSAFAELQIADGLTYRMNFGPDYTQLTERLLQRTVDSRHLREPRREQLRTRGSRRRPASSTSMISRTRSTTCFASTERRHAAAVRHHRALQHPARPVHEGLAVRHEPAVPDAALVRSRLGHGGQRSQPHLGVGAAVVHGPPQLHAARSLLGIAHRPRATDRAAWRRGTSGRSSRRSASAWQLGDESFMRGLNFLNSLKVSV